MRILAILFSISVHGILALGIWYVATRSTEIVIPLDSQTSITAKPMSESQLLQLLQASKQTQGKQALKSTFSPASKTLILIQPAKKQAKKKPKKPKKEQQAKKEEPKPMTESATETVQKEDTPDDETTQEEISPQQQQIITRYQKRIQSALINSWTRPSSVRTNQDLSVQIALELNADGTVKQAIVHETSGNVLFDRSAIAAVKKNLRFAVPDDKRLFDQYFANIIIAFSNPE